MHTNSLLKLILQVFVFKETWMLKVNNGICAIFFCETDDVLAVKQNGTIKIMHNTIIMTFV